MTNQPAAPVPGNQPTDGWRTRRIWIAGVLGAVLPASNWLLDFWPLGAGGLVRVWFDFSRLLFLLPLACYVAGLLIACGITLWRHRVRRAASSIVALAAIPVCFEFVARVPMFDPWLWYTIANEARFEALAAKTSPPTGPKYAVLEVRDVSTGLVGLDPNHFVGLIYDESDAVGLKPPDRPALWRTRSLWPGPPGTAIPRGRRLVGHFFRVDEFE